MGALKDLLRSERGLVAICLIAGCTVLCALSLVSTEQWLDYTKWLFLTYAAAKTVTGAVTLATKRSGGPNPMDALMGLLMSMSKPPATATAPPAGDVPTPAPGPTGSVTPAASALAATLLF